MRRCRIDHHPPVPVHFSCSFNSIFSSPSPSGCNNTCLSPGLCHSLCRSLLGAPPSALSCHSCCPVDAEPCLIALAELVQMGSAACHFCSAPHHEETLLISQWSQCCVTFVVGVDDVVTEECTSKEHCPASFIELEWLHQCLALGVGHLEEFAFIFLVVFEKFLVKNQDVGFLFPFWSCNFQLFFLP